MELLDRILDSKYTVYGAIILGVVLGTAIGLRL